MRGMMITDIQHKPPPRRARPDVRFALQAFHPATGEAVGARFVRIEAALGRGAALMQGGYCFEIWSPASLEKSDRDS